MRLFYSARESIAGEKWARMSAAQRAEARTEVLSRMLAHATDHGRVIAGEIVQRVEVDEKWRCVHVIATVATADEDDDEDDGDGEGEGGG